MARYALHDGQKVHNIIEADSLESAQNLIDELDAIEATGRIAAGWIKVGENFVPPKRHASWILGEDGQDWVAPIPRPTSDHVWNEETVSWILPTFDEE